ncbi:sigma-E factor negative regulatory protein [Halomonas halocynthiae]|uniref:sigma-E factor negative regulatory protein n=1 Tax=Halomonas halocynthiae TaxID=176290 RepID=UPI0004261B32|nr:RseA family anti-sigma factor [Halomonas halocynthiae]
MNLNARQSLSALMDDEGDDLELRRVLATLKTAPEEADSWRRYHLARSIMRRDAHIDTSVDLSADIMAKLEAEPVPASGHEASQSASLQSDASAKRIKRGGVPLARGAGIAAAVSLMVISGVQFYNGNSVLDGSGADLAAANNAPAIRAPVAAPSLVDLPMFQTAPGMRSNSGVMTVGAGGSTPMMLSPSQEQQSRAIDQQQALLLQSYLNRHSEGAAPGAGDSWMPLFRVSEGQVSGSGMSSQR